MENKRLIFIAILEISAIFCCSFNWTNINTATSSTCIKGQGLKLLDQTNRQLYGNMRDRELQNRCDFIDVVGCYLAPLSVAQTTWYWMIGWLANNECKREHNEENPHFWCLLRGTEENHKETQSGELVNAKILTLGLQFETGVLDTRLWYLIWLWELTLLSERELKVDGSQWCGLPRLLQPTSPPSNSTIQSTNSTANHEIRQIITIHGSLCVTAFLIPENISIYMINKTYVLFIPETILLKSDILQKQPLINKEQHVDMVMNVMTANQTFLNTHSFSYYFTLQMFAKFTDMSTE